MRDVASVVGLRIPSLYNHFPSKEALYAAVLERGLRPVLEVLMELVGSSADAERGSVAVERVVEILSLRPELPRLMQYEALSGGEHLSPMLREWIRPLFARAAELVDSSPASKLWNEQETALLVLALYNVVLGYFTIAPLYQQLNGEDLLAPEARRRQAAFLAHLVGILFPSRVGSDPPPEKYPMNLDVDFRTAEAWDSSMPARMAELREKAPVFWSDQSQLWVLSRFEDVEHVSKHQELFTSGLGVRPDLPTKIGLIDEGEPRHGRLRKLINRGFSPRMVAKLEIAFRKFVAERVDAIAQAEECDFVEAISVPLPLMMIAEMIGIHPEDRGRFHHWSDDMIAADGNMDDPQVAAKAMSSFVEYANYVTKIIEDRRQNPRDDLVSILVGAKDEGVLVHEKDGLVPDEMSAEEKDLANDELIKLLVVLLVAGNETTRNAISGGMQLLIEHPEQRRQLAENPALIPAAVEEMLRLVSPVHSFSRTVTADTELRGRRLRKGQRVLLLYPSANRDPDVFEDPASFRLDRNPQHLAFGVGTHFCLGANLARMEMRVTFEELLRRLPDMEYADAGPVIRPSPLVRTCAQMRVRFTAERPSALAC